ncbi:protein of unknown function [Burkholderia multivorans]
MAARPKHARKFFRNVTCNPQATPKQSHIAPQQKHS